MNNPAPTVKKPSPWPYIAAGIFIGVAAGATLMIIFGPGQTLLSRFGVEQATPAVPRMNAPAPDFELQTTGGEALRLSSTNGKIRLVNFWATWCQPCREEMPLLQEYQERYKDKLEVLAVNDDESAEKVVNFANELGLRMQLLLDPGRKVGDLYQVSGFPTTVFIDAQGNIRYKHMGILNRESLDVYLAELGGTK